MSTRNRWSASGVLHRPSRKRCEARKDINPSKTLAEVLGDGSVELTGFASADCARTGDLTFAEKDNYFAAAEQSQATAIIVGGDFTSSKKILIRVPDARVAVARVLPVFFPPDQHPLGIHRPGHQDRQPCAHRAQRR